MRLDLPIVASNDVHVHRPEHRPQHDPVARRRERGLAPGHGHDRERQDGRGGELSEALVDVLRVGQPGGALEVAVAAE